MTHTYVLICVDHKYWFLNTTYQCTNNTVPRFLHVSYNNRPAEQTFWAHWRRPNVQRTYCVIFDWRMTINADVASIGPILFSFDLEWIETWRFTETVQNISNISHHRRQTFLGRKRSKNVVSSTSLLVGWDWRAFTILWRATHKGVTRRISLLHPLRVKFSSHSQCFHFMLKLVHRLLPTGKVLHCWNPLESPFCPACGKIESNEDFLCCVHQSHLPFCIKILSDLHWFAEKAVTDPIILDIRIEGIDTLTFLLNSSLQNTISSANHNLLLGG